MKLSTQRNPSLVLFFALISLTPMWGSAQETLAPAKAITLKVSADRENAQYHVGETASFTIEVVQENEPLTDGSVVCIFSKDGWQPLLPQKIELKDGKAKINGKLDEPGFLQLRVEIGKVIALAGAAYDPLQLKPSMPAPDDFDEFWAGQKAALAKVTAKSTVTPIEAPAERIQAFDVKVDCLGKPVSGYFGRPANAQPKSLPAILFVHGAGVRSASLDSTKWATKEGGMLAFDINAHGLPNGQPEEFYTSLAKGELKEYRREGTDDREHYYFKGMFLRLVRAIDFLTTQPEWDGKTLIVYGSSQGGYQAFVAAGLDPRVTFICAGVPAGCDHTGSVSNRISGWPKFVSFDAQRKADPVALQTSRYYDCVNFASRAKCKGAAVTIGFIDTTCPPTSVYAAYNNLSIPKQIHADVGAGHTNTPAASKFMQEAAYKHVRDMK